MSKKMITLTGLPDTAEAPDPIIYRTWASVVIYILVNDGIVGEI
jgi:hypothetical protein